MSKPILIVVVVVDIDVVFVKNMLGQKNLVKKIHVQKNFKQKIVGSKRVRSRKVMVQKDVFRKIKVQKNFRSKKILGPKIFGYKNFLALKIWDLPLKFGQN